MLHQRLIGSQKLLTLNETNDNQICLYQGSIDIENLWKHLYYATNCNTHSILIIVKKFWRILVGIQVYNTKN